MPLGLGLPLLIHLLSRRPPKDHVFPATVFLLQAKSEKFSVSKIKNFLLLLLRTLIILLCLLALWRPQIKTSLLDTTRGRKGSFVLIIDNSLSMSYREKGEKSRFEEAKEKGLTLLSTLHETSQKAILWSSHPNRGTFTYSPRVASATLRDLKLSYGSRGLKEALFSARSLLKKTGQGLREIYVLTDLDRNSWEGLSASLSEDLKRESTSLFFVDLGGKGKPNCYFHRVTPRPATVAPNTTVTISFELKEVTEKKTVLFNVDGKRKGRLEISPVGPFTGEINWRFVDQGVYRCFLKIQEPDSLEEDNTHYFTIQVLPPRKILLVHKMLTRKYSSLFYLERALDPTGGRGLKRFSMERVEAPRLQDKDLSYYDLLIMVGPGQIQREPWQRIRTFVAQGGALVMFPPLSIPGDDKEFFSLFEIKKDSKALCWVPTDYEKHSLLSPFKEGKNGDLRAPEFFRHVIPSAVLSPPWERVLDYNNGEAAFLYRTFQEGMAFAFTSCPDLGEDNQGAVQPSLQWSTLPAEPAFPIFIHEMVKKIYHHKTPPPGKVDEPLRLFIGKNVSFPKIVGPDFKPRELTIEKGWVEFSETQIPGVYKIKGKRGDLAGVGVNVNPIESRLESVSEEEFKNTFKEAGVYRIREIQEIAFRATGAAYLQDITGGILFLLILLMVLESFLSNVEDFGEGAFKRFRWKKS